MDNFSIICDILCAVIWSASFGMTIDQQGITKWLNAACSVCFTAAAFCGVLGI